MAAISRVFSATLGVALTCNAAAQTVSALADQIRFTRRVHSLSMCPFDKITDADHQPAIEAETADELKEIEAIVNDPALPDFANTILALGNSGHYRLLKAFMRGSFEGTINAQRIKMVDALEINIKLCRFDSYHGGNRGRSERSTKLDSVQGMSFGRACWPWVCAKGMKVSVQLEFLSRQL